MRLASLSPNKVSSIPLSAKKFMELRGVRAKPEASPTFFAPAD
jgi:hypothetical protein